MYKIILFYKYIFLENPQTVLKWQTKLCHEIGLKGRIILAHEGINATLGGTESAIADYITAMKQDPRFADIDFKESPGSEDDFPRLRIVVKEEIVKLGINPQELSAHMAGEHLTPEQAHHKIATDKEIILLDGRNNYESRVGTFVGAITPDIKNFRDFPAYIDAHKELFKDKEVIMYCTGGIRCERASAYLKSKNVAKKVYQISGGIHRYVEQFPDGFFRGKNYVFDARISTRVNDDILTTCSLCPTACDDYVNCRNAICNKHFIACVTCQKSYNHTCSAQCQELVASGKTKIRPEKFRIPNNGTKTHAATK